MPARRSCRAWDTRRCRRPSAPRWPTRLPRWHSRLPFMTEGPTSAGSESDHDGSTQVSGATAASTGGGGAPVPMGAGTLPRAGSGSATRMGDRVFRGLSLGAGVALLAIIVAIAVFLVYRAVPALRANADSFF